MQRVVTVEGDARTRARALGRQCDHATGRLLEPRRARGVVFRRAHGQHYVVIRHRWPGQPGDTLISTHPGVPAYMGINPYGVACLWQCIHNGERDLDGVPTTALIRELLTCTSVDDAVAYLRQSPHAVPNNFSFCGSTTAVNVECAPSRFTAAEIDEGFFCHTNHLLADSVMPRSDRGAANPRSTAHARLDAIRHQLGQYTHPLGTMAERVLSAPPIYYERTLAPTVFVPSERQMSIHLRGDAVGEFHHLTTRRRTRLGTHQDPDDSP